VTGDAEQQTAFLNVDFELTSSERLSALLAEFDPGATPIRDDWDGQVHHVTLEVFDEQATVRGCIAGFLRATEQLSAPAREALDRCSRRCASVGVQAGADARTLSLMIELDQLAALAALGFAVELCVYGQGVPGGGG